MLKNGGIHSGGFEVLAKEQKKVNIFHKIKKNGNIGYIILWNKEI
jgi:hypothetical protein